MLSRSPVRPALVCAVLALASTSALCAAAATPPAVPPVAEIPIAPLPTAKKRLPPPPEATPRTTVTTTTTTTMVPSLAAVTVEPPPHVGATELMPAAPTALSSPPHVVLVDELPFRATHTHARELSEHEHEHEHEHAHHGKKKGRHGRPFHPAPGIVVDINDATGGASAVDLQRTGRNVGYWPFRHCYEEGLRRDQHMGGKVDLDLAVAPGGSVDRANITGATLHDESVVLCVAREAAHLALTPGESATSAKMELTLSTGDEPVPEPRPMPHADELRESLRASWPAVKQCYSGALSKRADDGGRLELRFHVKPSGEIAEVTEGDTRFGDVEVTRCVLGVYRGAKLPGVAHGSHDASFVYALHLEARPEQGAK
jgi:hypothetical protein